MKKVVDIALEQVKENWPMEWRKGVQVPVSQNRVAEASGVGRNMINAWFVDPTRGVSTRNYTRIMRGIEKVKKAIEEERKSAAGGEDVYPANLDLTEAGKKYISSTKIKKAAASS